LGILLALNKVLPGAGLLTPILATIIISGAVLSARLALHAHTPAQVYTGFGAGLLLVLTAASIAL
jgi:hypothetical protein